MVLQVDDSRNGHLHAPEDGHHLQDLIIKRWSRERLGRQTGGQTGRDRKGQTGRQTQNKIYDYID